MITQVGEVQGSCAICSSSCDDVSIPLVTASSSPTPSVGVVMSPAPSGGVAVGVVMAGREEVGRVLLMCEICSMASTLELRTRFTSKYLRSASSLRLFSFSSSLPATSNYIFVRVEPLYSGHHRGMKFCPL